MSATCFRTGKHCHTKGDARRQLTSLKAWRGDTTLRVYLCPYCGTHHVGHDRLAGRPEEGKAVR